MSGAALAVIAGVVCFVAGLAIGYALGVTDRAIRDSRAWWTDYRRRHPLCSCGAEVPVGTWHTCRGKQSEERT